MLNWRCTACHTTLHATQSVHVACTVCGKEYLQENGIWECAAEFSPARFSRERSNHVLDIERDHFWFDTRDQLLRTKLNSLREPQDQRVLELGCGSGRMLAKLSQDFSFIAGIEGHPGALKVAAARGLPASLLHGDITDTPLSNSTYDWILAFDVLEHVDPHAFLNEAFRLARPGGKLLISVPASPILWSRVDVLAGHRCRYRWSMLQQELRQTHWRPLGHTHFQFLLLPLLAASRMLNRYRQPRMERKPPKIVNRLLASINRLEIRFSAKITLPFGSSLIGWAQKPVQGEYRP